MTWYILYWIVAGFAMLYFYASTSEELTLLDVLMVLVLGGIVVPFGLVVVTFASMGDLILWRKKR